MSREVHVPFYERLGVQFPRPTHRFGVSFRDVEDLLAQRGLTVSYEAIRLWCITFGAAYARRLTRRQGRLGDTWHLDEVFVTIQGTAALFLVRRRSRWRRPRYPRPVASRLPGGHTLFSQAIEGPRASARAIGHRQAAQRQGCAPSGYAVRRPSHGPIREQPRRGVASTDATARATDAAVQIRCARAAVSLGPRTRAESLPSRATSTSVGAPALASDAGVRRMGCGDVCLLDDEGYRAIEGSSRPPLINLTVPSGGIVRASDDACNNAM